MTNKYIALVLTVLLALCSCSSPNSEQVSFPGQVSKECLKLENEYRGLDTSDTQLILDFLEGQGKCAVDGDNLLQMVNPQVIEEYMGSRESQPGSVLEVYQVYSDGGFMRYDLCKGSVLMTRGAWQGGLATVTMQKEYSLTDIKLTEKGNLMFCCDIPDNPASRYGHDGYIVPWILLETKAPDAELSQLCRKYVKPLGFQRCNLLTCDWNADDYSAVDFAGAYDRLFYMDTGKNLWDKDSWVYVDELSGEVRISAEDFSALLTQYLPVTETALWECDYYNSEIGAFLFPIDVEQSAFDTPQPYPEVIAKSVGSDGTLTLTVDQVFIDRGCDCLSRSELTVNPATGAYISNRVID